MLSGSLHEQLLACPGAEYKTQYSMFNGLFCQENPLSFEEFELFPAKTAFYRIRAGIQPLKPEVVLLKNI
jgi:hypothetical protein